MINSVREVKKMCAQKIDTESSVKMLSGIGDVRANAYARMGVHTVGQLLSHYPRGYEDRADVKLLSEAPPDAKCALELVIATEPSVRIIRRGMNLLKFRAYDDSGSCEITYFNQNYLKNTFVCGAEYRFYGAVEKRGNKYFMSSPDAEPIRDDAELMALVPVYPLTEGIGRKQILKDIKNAFVATATNGAVRDILPEELRAANKLCTLSFALRNIHFPTDYVSLAAAKKRLIYDEFLTFALGISLEGRKNREKAAEPCRDTDISPLLSILPYELTDAQARVCREIAADMSKSFAMSRMVVGDVGSGKTVCAAAAMYIAVKNGRQAALMVPTEILARQHFADISGLFSKLGIRCELLCGSLTVAQKRRVREGLISPDKESRIDVVIGTHAIISDGVEFFAPGIVVTDEQHRFGVSQRSLLSKRNERAHMLVMSATPIPRSLALAVYGDLDVSRIDQMPPGRQRVDTFAVDESYRSRLDSFISKQVEAGGQVYIVCPSIEDSEEEGVSDITLGDVDLDGNVSRSELRLRAAIPYAEELKKKFPSMRIEFLHGKLKSDEKDRVMLDFAAGKVDVLVSTTVIEVGVNVPNATLMIVENAERFGLSQLHQLRGRVGRGSRKSYCVLVSESAGKDSTAGERLDIMKKTCDGYEIAEKDLAMRGPGDFVKSTASDHVRQSGGVRFRLAELCDDTGLLKRAFADAATLIGKSPSLDLYPALKGAVNEMFSLDSSVIN